MADEENDNAEGKKKSGGSKTLIIIIAAAFLMFILLAGAGFYILWSRLPPSETANTESTQKEGEKAAELTVGPVFTLDPFVANLADREGNRFLRTKITLELVSEELLQKMEKFNFPVRDKILTILTSKNYQEISTVAGKKQLRKQITVEIDALVGKKAVKNVYFTDFVAE